MFGKKKNNQEDEIPRSVLKMKQEKEKREREEAKNRRSGKHGKRSSNIDEEQNGKKNSKKPKRKIIRKIILFIIIIGLIVLGVYLGISAHDWKELVTDMFNNENSVVVDTDGNTIAKLRL